MTTEPDTHLDAESRIPPRTDLLPPPSTVAGAESDPAPSLPVELSIDSAATSPGHPALEPPAKRERRHVWWMSFLAASILAALIALFGVIFVALPVAASERGVDHSASNGLPLVAGMLFIWAWIVFLGASFGSFINCVAWRLPRGIPITATNSACPKCRSKLRWHENLPIYGWLALNGQCGSCNEPIPARYFLVELFFAISFATIAYGDVLSGGLGIPFRPDTGTLWRAMYLDPTPSQVCICVFHLVAIVLLWLWALLSWDRHAVPKRTIFLALAALVVAATFWGEVIPVTVLSTPMPREIGLTSLWDGSTSPHWAQQSSLPVWSLGLVTSLAGLVCGTTIGWLGPYGQPGIWRRVNLVSACAIVGAVVGWQGSLSVALINSVLVGAIRMLPGGRQRQPLVLGLPAAFLIHLWTWRWTSTIALWPGPAAHWSIDFLTALIVVATHQVAWRLHVRKSPGVSGPRRDVPAAITASTAHVPLPVPSSTSAVE